MKTVVLNGSARKNGNTAFLLDNLMEKSSGDIVTLNSFDLNVSPCTNCEYCNGKDKCNIMDDMQEIYTLMENSDNIVIASPVYFDSLTPPLMSIMSRFQVYFSQKHGKLPSIGKQKRGVIILTAGGSSGVISRAEKEALLFLKVANATPIAFIRSYRTDKLPSKDDSNASKSASLVSTVLFS